MRRTQAALAVAVLAGAIAVHGCTGEPPAPAATGGTLIVAAQGDADVLLPPVAATQLAAHVTEQLFPQLAEITAELNTADDAGFRPSLARSWEHRDSLTIVFHLDARATWQDRRPIIASDVVFTFDVYRDTLTGSPYRVNLDPIESVRAENDSTVVFRFRRRYPEQLYDATYHLRIIPKHLLDTIPRQRLAASAFARAPVGAGPFRFVSWRPGAEIVVEADTAWFLGRPTLGRIVWRVVPDVSAALAALLAGEADAMETIPQKADIERVARDTTLRLLPYPSPFLGGFLFNLRRPLFADRALRRALAMAIDRPTLVATVFGPHADVPVGAVTRMSWIASDSVRQLPFDTAAAARDLDALLWRLAPGARVRTRGGQPLRFTALVPTTSRTRQEAAVLVQAQLRQVGVEMRILPLEYAVFDRRMRAGDFDIVFFSRTLDPSPAMLAQFWATRAIGAENAGAYASPAFDSLVTAAAAAPDRAGALPLWRAALERLNDDAAAVFLFSPRNNAAVHRRFTHVVIRPDSWLAEAATWTVPPERRLARDR